MTFFLIHIYRFFHLHKCFFYLFLALLSGFILLFASKIRLEENITRLTSGKDSLNRYEYVIRNFKFADKLIVHLSLKDTNAEANPEYLFSIGEALRDSLLSKLDTAYIRQVFLQFNDSLFQIASGIIDQHLPLFLTDTDYKTIESLMQPEHIDSLLRNNFRLMVMPAGILLKQRIVKDPLGISGLAFQKLNSLQPENQYTIYNGSIFSPDKKHLLMFITPANLSSETKKNSTLIANLEKFIALQNANHAIPVNIEYYGYAATAVCNASQIKWDIILSLGIAIMLIFFFIGWYFRNFLIPLLGFVPAIFGGGLAMAILFLFKGCVSFIALGIGSVILGLIIDYTLYIVNHYRKKQSVEQVITDMSQTIMICGLTTIGVFLCLTFLNSEVLHDLGWFTAISVFGASVCSLVILPQFLGKQMLPADKEIIRTTFIDRIAAIDFGKKRWLVTGLAFAGVASIFVSNRVKFEKDMNSLNYMSEKLKNAEQHLDQISGNNLKSVYIVSTGKDINDASRWNEITQKKLETLKGQGKIQSFSGVGSMFPSDSIQQERLNKWNGFWTKDRKSLLLSRLEKSGKRIGFNGKAFSGIKSMINITYSPLQCEQSKALRLALFSDWINVTPEMIMISGIAKVTDSEKQFVYREFSKEPNLVVFDRQNLTTRFVVNVKHDFELLVTLSMVFVTLLLLISFGRIELAIISSLPMFFSWLITLGFMGITGIRFNIFNIIISSFIFGLGVDYSILMMRGLISKYRSGVDDMKTYRVSILLSSTTTLFGVGALFFARHPALNSIALISMFGIISVVIISLSYQSMLARWFLLNPQEKRSYPMTARNILHAIFISWIPISLIAFLLVIYSRLISPLLPLKKERKQNEFHEFFNALSRLYINLNFPRHHSIENVTNETFQKPAIIICNHQSLIETPALLRLYPKIVILANEWVFRNWIFGPVARVAGFISVNDNIDNSLSLIKQRIVEGYSVLIFPEGHRSKDGHIQRFHHGAFYIAEKLNLDILPVMIFGSGGFLPKGIFWGKPNRLFTQILPRILPESQRFGTNYSERTKQVRRYYQEEYLKFRTKHNTPAYNVLNLRLNYLFKGPSLEWSLRTKMILENNFDCYCNLLPGKGDILDLGCGYGYISYMLMLNSNERRITGVDSDSTRINIANHGYLKNDNISFIEADISEYPVTMQDGFLLGDSFRYLAYDKQKFLLQECMRNLRPGGTILIREGKAEKETLKKLRDIACEHGFTFELIEKKRLISDNFIVIHIPVKDDCKNIP
ncbi:MAG: 1-acyl-sn-glycerol-3-phosphate acyltransferase [Bacteroidetes bacterium]|nr:1-acyl-sn-glycerol-3-phosphate acyltransferase [Bacteroidota bacterium]